METSSISIQEYIEKNHPEIIEEHRRLTTPNYYFAGGEYNPLRSGFGCIGASNKILVMSDIADYVKGDICLTLYDKDKPSNKYSVSLSKAHRDIKLAEEPKVFDGKLPKNSGVHKYITRNGCEYTIYLNTWREYQKNTLCVRMIVHRSIDAPVKVYGVNKQPYFEVYSHFGSRMHLKHVHGYDSVGREMYNGIKFDINVHKVKELIFGDPNIKLKCDLFEQYR
jgi:hypothetical protein